MNKNLRWKNHRHPRRSSRSVDPGRSTRRTKKVRLGLDLKGGVHLVLRVQTDDALRLETETAMERLRDELVKAGAASVTTADVARARRRSEIDGVTPAQDAQFRQAATEVEHDLRPRRPASTAPTRFRMKPNIAEAAARRDGRRRRIRTIERRVNELGVAEPIVARQGGARSDPRAAARASPTSAARRRSSAPPRSSS